MIALTTFAFWPKRSTRPSRRSSRLGFHGRFIVDDGGELLLQIDAFAQAIGDYTVAPPRPPGTRSSACRSSSASAPVIATTFADGKRGARLALQLLFHIVGRGDIAAPHNRLKRAVNNSLITSISFWSLASSFPRRWAASPAVLRSRPRRQSPRRVAGHRTRRSAAHR